MIGILNELDLPVILLEGRMTPEDIEELLQRDYSEVTPCKWEQVLLEDEYLLGPGSVTGIEPATPYK